MKPQRPPLAQLVDDGIVKGLLKMNLDRGDYIGHTPLHDFNSKSRALSWVRYN